MLLGQIIIIINWAEKLECESRVSKKKDPGILDPGHFSEIIWTFLNQNNDYMCIVFMFRILCLFAQSFIMEIILACVIYGCFIKIGHKKSNFLLSGRRRSSIGSFVTGHEVKMSLGD